MIVGYRPLRRWASAGLASAMLWLPAICQAATASMEVRSDYRWRGLSWSDGRPTIGGQISAPIEGLNLDMGLFASRNSRRHEGANTIVDIGLHHSRSFGAWRIVGGATGYVFPDAGRLSFVEVDAGGGVLVGPAQIDLKAAYAPRQEAIGGDNFYLSAGTVIAVPATPFTILAGVGRSTGDTRRINRARRLRPSGDYTDAWLGVDHVRGPLRIGFRYTITSGDDCPTASTFCDGHGGNRFAGLLSLTL